MSIEGCAERHNKCPLKKSACVFHTQSIKLGHNCNSSENNSWPEIL